MSQGGLRYRTANENTLIYRTANENIDTHVGT